MSDKIYIQPNAHDRWWEGDKPNDNFVEYIRKDISDKTIELAEDHAFFAGSEAMREKVLDLAEKHYEKFQDTMQEWNGSMFQSSKLLACFAEFIDKLKKI